MRPVPRRRSDPELMDGPGLPAAEVEDAYRVLRRVNRQFFGGMGSLRRELRRWLDEDRPPHGSTVVLLDLGSGSGDLPSAAAGWVRERGRSPLTIALDRDPIALRMAATSEASAVRADAMRLPFPDRSVEVVSAVKFAHHFEGPALVRLLAEMARVARRRVIVLDIRRDWLAYWGFLAWSRLFTRSRLVRHDGALSVLRGFTAAELSDLARSLDVPDYRWEVRPHLGFQLALVGRRGGRAPADPGD